MSDKSYKTDLTKNMLALGIFLLMLGAYLVFSQSASTGIKFLVCGIVLTAGVRYYEQNGWFGMIKGICQLIFVLPFIVVVKIYEAYKEGQVPAPDNKEPIAEIPKSTGESLKPGCPPLALLGDATGKKSKVNTEKYKAALIKAFASFDISVDIGSITTGPTVTRYELIVAEGVKSNKLFTCSDDIGMRLGFKSFRILAENTKIWAEIANDKPSTVTLREIIETYNKENDNKYELPVYVGAKVDGKPLVLPLEKVPHLLVAGATGAGKSVCVHSILLGLLAHLNPDECKFLMIDPKMVEMVLYEELPHLLAPIATTPEDANSILKWAVIEMERRYTYLKDNKIRNYIAIPKDKRPFPFIIVVIDEVADLLMAAKDSGIKEIETNIARIAQKARAAGMCLILATQRPDSNILSGYIRTNIPGRIALKVGRASESTIILDQTGAEKLIGKGDCLCMVPGFDNPVRAQGALVEDHIPEVIAQWWRDQCPDTDFVELDDNNIEDKSTDPSVVKEKSNEDLTIDAINIALKHGKVTARILQDELGIRAAKASVLLSDLENRGWIGSYVNPQTPREILKDNIPPEILAEFEEKDEPEFELPDGLLNSILSKINK